MSIMYGVVTVMIALFSISVQSEELSKIYTNSTFNYEFTYPGQYRIANLNQRTDYGFFITEGKRSTEVYIEDWSKNVDNFKSFLELAENRATVGCMADGPDCSEYCTVKEKHEIINKYFTGIEFILNLFSSCHPDSVKIYDPIYIFSFNKNEVGRILIFRNRINGQGINLEDLKKIIASLRKTK
jgi:hypothetical protein